MRTKDSCWSMGMIMIRELSGVRTATANLIVDRVLQMVSEPTLTVSRASVG